MGTYILLLNWTDQGIKTVKEAPKRAESFEKMVEGLGGEASYWYTLGQYDLIAVVKLPDDESMVELGLELGRLGNIRSSTLKAMSKKDMARVFSRLK